MKTASQTDAISLNWTPYIGWGGVSGYRVFRCKPGDSVNYRQIAFLNGSQLQYYDSNAICDGKYHYFVTATSPSLTDTSHSNISIDTPNHVNLIPAVNLLSATVSDNRRVVLQWQKINDINIAYYLVEKSNDGGQYRVISSLPPDSLSFTDYSANVQKQAYYYLIRAMDSCGDIGKPGNPGKTIFLQIDTTGLDMTPKLVWNNYVLWPEGVKYYSIMQEDASGNFKMLDRAYYNTDTVYTDTTTNLNSLPYYCYEIIAHRNSPPNAPGLYDSISSVSNIGCMHEEKSYIYIPNAFTPNGDGLNDRFGAKGLYITEFSMRIYTRWGELVYSNNSIFDSWDGRFNGKICDEGTYIWMATVKGLDNNIRYLYGNVNLMK